MIPLARPMLGEEEQAAAMAVLRSGQIAQGPRVDQFEREFAEFIEVQHAVAVSSGTAALYVALKAYEIGPGDEVITTPFTFGATANAILAVGARPVFVDVEPTSGNLDASLVPTAITERTKAILPVHLYGQPADLDPLLAIAERHGLALIEDACQAVGARYRGRFAGSFGTGCFSFYPTKNMTTTEGGMLTTNDDRIAEMARAYRNHGQHEARYRYEVLGLNWRMTDLEAAIGSVQLGKLPAWNATRRRNAARLTAGIRGVATPSERPGAEHVYHLYTIRVPGGHRDLFASELTMRGIGNGIYYPLPMHRQPLYRKLGYGEFHLPRADAWAAEALSIPVHPALSADDLDAIVAAVNDVAAHLGLSPEVRA